VGESAGGGGEGKGEKGLSTLHHPPHTYEDSIMKHIKHLEMGEENGDVREYIRGVNLFKVHYTFMELSQ
jgi:hypothetical protein